MTVRGEVRYKRTLLKPADAQSRKKLLETENIKGVYPLDMYLGVCGYPFKMTVEMMLLIGEILYSGIQIYNQI